MLVGRRDVDEGDVHRNHARADEPGDLGEEHRHPVGAALVDGSPHVRSREERPVAERPGVRRVHVGGGAERQQVRDLDVAQLAARATRAFSSSSGLLQPACSQTCSPEATVRTAASAEVTLRR